MAKNTYWIADPEGVRAPVEGADARDLRIRVHGWTESTEPDRLDFVWLHNPDNPELGTARMTWEAAQLDAWAGRGWVPGLPSETDAEPAAVASAKSSPKSGTAGDKKE